MTQDIRVEVPEGCRGLDFPDGSKAHGRGDGLVLVDDHQAAYVRAVGGDVKLVGKRVSFRDATCWRPCAHPDCVRDTTDESGYCWKHRGGAA